MTIYYRDNIGECACDIDDNNVQFVCGQAWFTSGGVEYRVDLAELVEIVG